jgi:hypothetical protein
MTHNNATLITYFNPDGSISSSEIVTDAELTHDNVTVRELRQDVQNIATSGGLTVYVCRVVSAENEIWDSEKVLAAIRADKFAKLYKAEELVKMNTALAEAGMDSATRERGARQLEKNKKALREGIDALSQDELKLYGDYRQRMLGY